MMRIAWLLGLVAGCSPDSPDWVVVEPDDTSYALGDVWRVSDDTCADAVTGATLGESGAMRFVNGMRTIDIDLVLVDSACTELPVLSLAPGEEGDVGLYSGQVTRVYGGGALLSAWYMPFMYGGTVVVQP